MRSGTGSLRLNEIPTVTIENVSYRVFLLNIDEPRNGATLSLDELRIYASSSPNLGGYDAGSKQLGGRSAIFDLDAGGDVTVKMNANLNRGKGDAFVLIPDSVFAGGNGQDYITLYSKLGSTFPAGGGGRVVGRPSSANTDIAAAFISRLAFRLRLRRRQ